MPGGRLVLVYGDTTLEIGTVTTIQESMQKSCTVVPLVSMPVDDTFAVESRSSKVINIQFKRNNADSSPNNSSWASRMEQAMNRWQCRTDGFKLRYEADSDNPYIAEINENGYAKSFIYRASAGNPEVLEGSLEFHVGTMYCGSQVSHPYPGVEGRDQSEFYVSISDVQGVASYTLLGNGLKINCIDSYTLSGGPESPFEYLEMTIPRNRLAEVAPPLVEEDGIVAGRNRVTIRAIGESQMIVTKCKLNSNKYKITAYCTAERLRGCTLKTGMSGLPGNIILGILRSSEYGSPFDDSNIILNAPVTNTGVLNFSKGRNVWYVLQVAAMCMGCRIFFADNKAYVLDYRNPSSNIDDCGEIDVFPTNSDRAFTVNEASLGDEGIDTIINQVQLYCNASVLNESGDPEYEGEGENAKPVTEMQTIIVDGSEASQEAYGVKSGNVIYVDDLIDTEDIVIEQEPEEPAEGEEPVEPEPIIVEGDKQATAFGTNLMDYRDEPQQSISFTTREMVSGPRWEPMYRPNSRASKIKDTIDNVIITNISDLDGNEKPQKLYLSSYERQYPKGTTTYTWGVMANIDLSSSTSQITTALDNSKR